MKGILLTVSAIISFNACTTANLSNSLMVAYDANTKYAVENTENGFKLMVDYSRYQFIPETDAILTACRSALTSIAYEVARSDSKSIKTINEQEIRVSSGRNGLTGVTTCQASVPVWFSD